MENSYSSLPLLDLVSVIFFYALFVQGVIADIIAASNSSSTNEEQKAFYQSGWGAQNISEYCKWNGIVCNEAQSVTEISTKNNFYIPSTQAHIQRFNVAAFPDLISLELSGSGLKGNIPLEISSLKKLVHLDLSSNCLQGELPSSLSSLNQLQTLNISNNFLTGEIPSTLQHLIHLKVLDLSHNKISGVIPKGISALTELTSVQLSWNQINGSLPSGIGKILRLQSLDISNNHLKGPIPDDVLKHCQYVQLRNNSLNGSIPSPVGNISYLDLSYNDLTGNIPEALHSVSHLNLSYNSFNASDHSFCGFPKDSLIGNKDMKDSCSFDVDVSDADISLVMILVFSIFNGMIFSMVLVCWGIHVFCPLHNEFENGQRRKNGDMLSIWNYDGKIAFEDIIKATEDFDIKYCIGTGAYGSVYKAQLPSGRIVALKKLHKAESENPSSYKSFCNETKILTEIRHRNIIKLYGFCLHNKCMFLVYVFSV